MTDAGFFFGLLAVIGAFIAGMILGVTALSPATPTPKPDPALAKLDRQVAREEQQADRQLHHNDQLILQELQALQEQAK